MTLVLRRLTGRVQHPPRQGDHPDRARSRAPLTRVNPGRKTQASEKIGGSKKNGTMVADMGLMLHRRDGTIAVRCGKCGKMCDVPGSSSGVAVCGKCVRRGEVPLFTGRVYTARDLPKFMGSQK